MAGLRTDMTPGGLWFGESRPWGHQGRAKAKRSAIPREAPPTGMGPENEGERATDQGAGGTV